MKIWAIGDLHLSFGIANKSMDVFGPAWESHAKKIEENWRSLIDPADLVLIPGDISWAMRIEDAIPDLQWIHDLPGTKVMIKGNHDYWWGSLKKVNEILPPSLHIVQNNSFVYKGIAIGGARLWDTPEYNFGRFVDFRENPKSREKKEEPTQEDQTEKLFERELQRLELSLSTLPANADMRIAMTHYPPIGADLAPSRASHILEKHKIDVTVFGHLHNLKPNSEMFGEKNGVRYLLTSCDYLHFIPLIIQ